MENRSKKLRQSTNAPKEQSGTSCSDITGSTSQHNKAVINLYDDGWTVKEISKILNLTVGQVLETVCDLLKRTA
jgi:DNA-binding NarL/FixJ family response regulator